MPTFTFDENKTPQENVELFYGHLRSVDPELTAILQLAIAEILPLPEAGFHRNAKRTGANNIVQRTLDSLP